MTPQINLFGSEDFYLTVTWLGRKRDKVLAREVLVSEIAERGEI